MEVFFSYLFIGDILKFRYLLLPMIIISLMIFTINNDNVIVNKKIVFGDSAIDYPFFNNNVVDNYFGAYLSKYEYCNNILIDYDYYNVDNKYYITFYKYIFNNNIVINDYDSFIVDTFNNNVIMCDNEITYDFVINKSRDISKKYIALTFDDGPNYNTNKIINILNKYNVKATFFILGTKINNNEYILEKMKDSGMEIGNHTFSHLLLTSKKDNVIKNEIDNTSNLIYSVIGENPILFRPSYGAYNKRIRNIIDYPIILWDIDTLDWKYHNSKKITNRVINKVKDGDIILMHDIYSATSNSLENIIPILQERGYEFVTISELFYYKNISLKNGSIYRYAR